MQHTMFYILRSKSSCDAIIMTIQMRGSWGAQITCTRSVVTKFCMVVPCTCGSSVWCSLHVTVLEPRIWRLRLRLQKICAHLLWRTFCLNYCTLCLKSLYMKAPGLEPMTSWEKLKENMQKHKQNGINWYCSCFSLGNL